MPENRSPFRVRAIAWTLLTVSFVGGCDRKRDASSSAPSSGGSSPEADFTMGQGVWKLSAVEGSPKYRPKWLIEDLRQLTITGHKFSLFSLHGRELSGNITIDVNTNPKQCAFDGIRGPDDPPRLGIYDLTPTTFRLAMLPAGFAHPSTQPGAQSRPPGAEKSYYFSRPSKIEPSDNVIVYTFTR